MNVRVHRRAPPRTVNAKGVGTRPYVRVIDAAGNRSTWVRAARKR